MNTRYKKPFFLLLGIGCLLSVTRSGVAQRSLMQYVDTRIGTAPSTTPTAKRHSEAGSELKGQTIPAVGFPHAMTNWTPQTQATEVKCIAPYYYNDAKINGFRGTHWMNGSCVQDYGTLTIMPFSGPLKLKPADRGSSFLHNEEIATPAYYQVRLTDYAIQAKLSAHTRAGLLQFTFEGGGESGLLIEPNSDEGMGFVHIDPEKAEITGYNPVHRIYQGAGQSAGFSGYFVAQMDAPFSDFGTWQGNQPQANSQTAQGTGKATSVGAYVRWQLKPGQVVHVRVGTSFVSLEQARQNLTAELNHWSLDRVRQQAEAAWNQELGKMQAVGNAYDKKRFYTALYRAQLTPRIFSDVNGSYPGFADDTTVHQARSFVYYCDFNLWDTFRAVHPLLNILDPRRSADMMESLVKKGEQGGWMPIFPCWNQYTAAMIGDHALSVIADAYGKGIRHFDIQSAYRLLRKNAFDVNTDATSYANGLGRRALASYLHYGYVPLEDSVWQAFHKREQVSRTLEYGYDDFCLGQLAQSLGKKSDASILLKRALAYQAVIDPQTGYARGRYANGRWVDHYDPFTQRISWITEGSPAQYTFFVPQDVAGLINVLGGRQRFVKKLDTLFNGWHYWHGNEPNNQIAYLYAYTGQPWKTQARIRQLIRDEYDGGPGGLSGNEDGGQMSAWLVFSMAGLYPVCPGTDQYVLGSPQFNSVTIHPPAGKSFLIRAVNNSAQNLYIQSATLNGKPFSRTYLTHQELLGGGQLVLQMGATPNLSWGSRAQDAPTSLSYLHN